MSLDFRSRKCWKFVTFSRRSVFCSIVVLIIFFVEQNRSKFRRDQCEVSLNESDGFLCESDEKWTQRRKFYRETNEKNRMTMNEYENYFKTNWRPEFECEHEIRLGEDDGGKWVR